jgi:hypothetical protein
MIFYRNRGWLIIPLFLLALLGPAFLFEKNPLAERVCHVGLLLACAGPVYWLGTRSFRLAAASLGRPLRAHEVVFDLDWGDPKPFDSLTGIHVRWWSIGFVVAAVAILCAGFQ